MKSAREGVIEAFSHLAPGISLTQKGGLTVTSPADGAVIAELAEDDAKTLDAKIARASAAQKSLCSLTRAERVVLLETLSAAIKQHREKLAELVTLEGGKTTKEALAEVDGSADIILKTCKDASLADLTGMHRCKERPPVGIVGLITSFNFPIAVANWTIAPALLAASAVLWKPSEKTPLTALAYKAVFDQAMGGHADLLQILIGGRAIGEAMVAHESVDMISATGSVGMGKGIKAALAKKKNNSVKPILELGGNNGVIISERMSPEHLQWAVASLLNSFLGTSGQRCTNTRRLIVHRSMYERVVGALEKHLQEFLDTKTIVNPLSGASNDYGYGPLIDKGAYERFEHAKKHVLAEGGKILLGDRLYAGEFPHAYYVEPALAMLPSQTSIMHEETFAPILFIAPYDGEIAEAIAMVNAPANAGLVNGIYTQSRKEADEFAARNLAGHGVINSPKGTGTPAFGMGFGGNKDSGEGEILNSTDPLRAFTREDAYRRIAQNADVVMDFL